MVEVGDVQIYRLRDSAPSERVRVVAVIPGKKSARHEIEFLDGDGVGRVEEVPAKRLRGPWAKVAEFDELMANWERVATSELDDDESSAVDVVFNLLIPREVATTMWSPVQWTTAIHDARALEPVIGLPVDDLLASVPWFARGGDRIVSPEGSLMIAEYACRVAPMPVLEWAISDEKEYRKRSAQRRDNALTPYQEFESYREFGRPLHELLRGWCGHRAVTLQERLAAAEAEVDRLDALVVQLIDQLKQHGHTRAADIVESSYDDERITAANFRPLVERPLKPSEMPVRYERAPRRWGY